MHNSIKATTATPLGIGARRVDLEVTLKKGPFSLTLSGLSKSVTRETRGRVQAALRAIHRPLSEGSFEVQVLPSDLPIEARYLDLPIATALLAATGHISAHVLQGRLLCGELGLDGSLHSLRSGLALAELARREGLYELILPLTDATEASVPITGPDELAVAPARNLEAVVQHLAGTRPLPPLPRGQWQPGIPTPSVCMSEIRGRESAKRALEIAAAGGHHVLLVGPPGSEQTRLARALVGILPELTHEESLELTQAQSRTARFPLERLPQRRPFRCPHPSISHAGLFGGSNHLRPGEVTLAHHGVLFLDDLAEFRRDLLTSLSSILATGSVDLVRTWGRVTLPARIQLVAATSPCPCGYFGASHRPCTCTPTTCDRFARRLVATVPPSVGLCAEVYPSTPGERRGGRGEDSPAIRHRVGLARQRQRARAGVLNGELSADQVQEFCALDHLPRKLVTRAVDQLKLGVRDRDTICRVARTLADLADSDRIGAEHVAEAIQYHRKALLRPFRGR